MSLFEFRGTAARQSGLGKEVNTAAKAKGVAIVYQPLPEHLQKPEFKSVATYPVSFLNEYFGVQSTPTMTLTLEELSEKLNALERQFTELLQKLEINTTNSYDDDDLPF
jgi:hypothetical protein